MDITLHGKKHPAFYLIMKREFAQQILDGTKQVEYRFPSPHNLSILFKYDRKKDDVIGKKDVEFIHFSTYNKSFFLDVHVKEMGFVAITRKNAEIFKEKYNSWDIEYECEYCEEEGIPEDDRGDWIYLVIDALVDTDLKVTPGCKGLPKM